MAPPVLRHSCLSCENGSTFNERNGGSSPCLRCNWRYGGSYVVATEAMDGCFQLDDPCSAGTQAWRDYLGRRPPRSSAGFWSSASTRPGDLRPEVPSVRSAALRHHRSPRRPVDTRAGTQGGQATFGPDCQWQRPGG